MGQTGCHMGTNLVAIGGVALLLLLCIALSTGRRHLRWRTLIWGILLQLIFAALILKTAAGRWFFASVNDLILELLSYVSAGTSFVFGSLATEQSVGFIFAFQVLPTIVFFASLTAILYHLRVLQLVVSGLSRFMQTFLGTSGAETFAVSANVFLGYIESPLLVRPYLRGMTRSEITTVMTAGMATVAGGVMVAFVGMLGPLFPDIAGHLLAASVMSVPAAIAIAKLLVPEQEEPETVGRMRLRQHSEYQNVIDAAASGAATGVQMAISIAATLIAFIALLALMNGILGWVAGVTLQELLGYALAPVAYILGVPWSDCLAVGQLLGEKTILNEFVAFIHLQTLLEEGVLSERSIVITTYALCGFANFASLGAMIGGLGALVPERRRDIARFGLRALIGGTIASFLTGAIAGLMVA
jgi:concentrative nucleoside transporter, CNT family